MVYASDFRKGITFEMNGEPHVVLDFQHVKPGKGAAFVRTKYRNILTGATREEAFNPNDKFPKANIETKTMEYLYNDGELYYFMDGETYDQVPLPFDLVEDAIKYLKENDEATIKFYKGNAFIVEAPNFVNLKVVETEPVSYTHLGRPGYKDAELQEYAQYLRREYQADVRIIDIPKADVSSTEIRRRSAAGKSIRYLTPNSVADYIEQRGLYKEYR